MVILATDGLLFLLVAAVVAGVFYCKNQPFLLRPWRKVSSNKSAMISLLVLVFFVGIGLLDSVHFKSNLGGRSEVVSLIDYWADDLRNNTETTYSAPFAAYSFAKELQVLPDGASVRRYPRLRFAASHLQDPASQWRFDALSKGLAGFGKGAGAWLLLLALYGTYSRYTQRSNAADAKSKTVQTKNPAAKAIWITLLLLIGGSWALVELSNYYHIFGTDKVGEDVFYQSLKSIRTGLVIGALTTLIMLPLAVGFGITAGFFGGRVDDITQYIYTTLNSIPSVLLIAASILAVQVYMANHPEDFTSVLSRSDWRLLSLCLILGITSWTGLCRILRAETLKLRQADYVQASIALGVSRAVILRTAIFPNVVHLVLIAVALDFSGLVLAEAVLSYINIGVDPATYSWGNMINGARLEMGREPVVWWSLLSAFVFMFALVLATNLFADALRDAFDPRREQG